MYNISVKYVKPVYMLYVMCMLIMLICRECVCYVSLYLILSAVAQSTVGSIWECSH